MKHSFFRRKRLLYIATMWLCIAVLVVLCIDYVSRTQGTALPPLTTPRKVEHAPSEKTPSTSIQPVAAMPYKISIPRINTEGYIEPVEILEDGHLGTPSNVGYAGWYVGSAKPGEKGVSVIDGHVSGRYRGGIFVRLHELQPGDEITIVMGDTTTRQFKVKAIATVGLTDSQKLFTQMDSVERQLNLITCSGNYDRKTQTYDHRLIVYAERVDA